MPVKKEVADRPSWQETFESGLMADAIKRMKVKAMSKDKDACVRCGGSRGENGTRLRCRPCADFDAERKRKAYSKKVSENSTIELAPK